METDSAGEIRTRRGFPQLLENSLGDSAFSQLPQARRRAKYQPISTAAIHLKNRDFLSEEWGTPQTTSHVRHAGGLEETGHVPFRAFDLHTGRNRKRHGNDRGRDQKGDWFHGWLSIYSYNEICPFPFTRKPLFCDSLRSGLRLDESFGRHFKSGYALAKACIQLAYAIDQA